MTTNKLTLGLVTTIKATRQETMDFINYHNNIGIDYLYMFFDDPNDEVISHIHFSNVICIRCDENHWRSIGCTSTHSIETRQTKNANLALQWMKEIGVDWVTHIDSDELIYTKRSLHKAISSLEESIDYLILPPKESVPTKLNYKLPYRQINLFKVLPNEDQLANVINNNVLFEGEYFRGHTSGKSFTKVSANISSLGIHCPIFSDTNNINSIILNDASVLHFDCYDPASWSNKWSLRISGKSIAADCRPNRLQQKKIYQESNISNDPDSLIEAYKKMYFIDPSNITELLNIGLLERIYINKKLFKRSLFQFTKHYFKELLTSAKH